MTIQRWRCVVLVGLLAVLGCGPDSTKPAGTASDPVEVCEQLAQVCRYQGSKLGVCTKQSDGTLFCASQH